MQVLHQINDNKSFSTSHSMTHPCPARVKVQMVLSKTRAALAALKRERQSAVVKVLRTTNCKLAATDPGWLV